MVNQENLSLIYYYASITKQLRDVESDVYTEVRLRNIAKPEAQRYTEFLCYWRNGPRTFERLGAQSFLEFAKLSWQSKNSS